MAAPVQFPAIFILLILWLVISIPLKKLNEAAKKGTQKKAPPAGRAPGGTRPEKAPAPGAAPEGYSPLRPSISVTAHDDSIYRGSLNAVTGEGYDPCHDQQLSSLTEAESRLPAEEPAVPALQLSWTGNDIVRGLVVGEILRRK